MIFNIKKTPFADGEWVVDEFEFLYSLYNLSKIITRLEV